MAARRKHWFWDSPLWADEHFRNGFGYGIMLCTFGLIVGLAWAAGVVHDYIYVK